MKRFSFFLFYKLNNLPLPLANQAGSEGDRPRRSGCHGWGPPPRIATQTTRARPAATTDSCTATLPTAAGTPLRRASCRRTAGRPCRAGSMRRRRGRCRTVAAKDSLTSGRSRACAFGRQDHRSVQLCEVVSERLREVRKGGAALGRRPTRSNEFGNSGRALEAVWKRTNGV